MPSRLLVQRRQPDASDLLALPPGVADTQAGVMTRAHLASIGVTASMIDAAVSARRWRTLGRQVVVVTNGPLTQRQREWAAVLLIDKPAALAGPTAAALAGLRGFESPKVHVVVPHDTHTAMPSWVKIHESRRFRQEHIVGSGPPRTSTSRSVIDTASWSDRPRRACAVLCASVQQRLVRSERLESELRQAGRIRHVAIMRDVLGDIGGGGHTLAEIDLWPLARRAGLPPPRRQALRRERSGKVRYVDAEFDLPDGQLLVVEIDGAVHLQPLSYWDDMDRHNELTIGGSDVLRFASMTVRLDEAKVVDHLNRMRLAHSR